MNNLFKTQSGTCKNCGVEFVRTSGSQKYCSKECFNTRRIKKENERYNEIGQCTICNASFNKANKTSKYCSKKCANLFRSKNSIRSIKSNTLSIDIVKVCEICDTKFTTTNKRKKFCCKKCSLRSDVLKRLKNTVKLCEVCGTEFKNTGGNRKTCSIECGKIFFKRLNTLEYLKQNPETYKYMSEYRSKKYFKNKDRYRNKRTELARKYRKTNTRYRIMNLLRHSVYMRIKYDKKSNKTIELIGCSVIDLINHLQTTAISNGYLEFDINNYSGRKYHIDHIIPCSLFDLTKEEEQKKCFNYTNLQILSAKENLQKSNKFTQE